MPTPTAVAAVDGTDIDISADSLCVHGDTAGAVDIARRLGEELTRAGHAPRLRRAMSEQAERSIRRVGSTALLVELDDLTGVLEPQHRLRQEPPAGLLELVPAARTLFVAYDPQVTTGDALSHTLAGLSTAEVVARHTAPLYTVAFSGFAPGFGYLTGTDPALRLPRRAEPRTGVAAGAVAVAGGFTGIYPRSSPGGWQLLGTTTLPLWDERRDPPALLVPGRSVRLRAVSRP
ncbi:MULTISPECIES: carboxyltransferase domain-containing protein [unclassified Streptomyces]|uniref:5-oxoprolinase subunit B family protein n=1 Tax=unclassified Streptomyces TaxID=2593676 RepID=UPI0033EDBDBF